VGEVLEAVGMVARLKGKKPARRFDCLLQIKAAFGGFGNLIRQPPSLEWRQ
jgi:hypothetical protein